MEALSKIGSAQDAFLASLHKQTTAKDPAMQKVGAIDRGYNSSDANAEKTQEAAQEFVAFFVGQMMEQMMAGIESDPMFGGGQGEEVWRSMLNQEYGKAIAKSGRLGIADHVMATMLQVQEAQTAAAKSPSESNPPASESAAHQSAATLTASIIRREE